MRKKINKISLPCILFLLMYFFCKQFLIEHVSDDIDAYAKLQSAELAYRSTNKRKLPILIRNYENSNDNLLGIPTEEGDYPYVWVILNRVSRDKSMLILPQNIRGRIDCAFVQNMGNESQIAGSVMQYLHTICH